MSWLATYWPVVGGVFSIVSPIVMAAFILWMKSQFATQQQVEQQAARIDLLKEAQLLIAGRVQALEDDAKREPTRGQLGERLGGLAERLAGVEKGLVSLERIGGTTNNYLELLVEKGLRQ